MQLHCTVARHGLLNNSLALPVRTGGDCRAAVYRNQLFCTFVDEGEPNRVCYASRLARGGWSGSIDVGCEGYQGTPAIFTFKDSLYILAGGDFSGRELAASPKLARYDDSRQSFTVEDFGINFQGTPALVEYKQALYLFYRARRGGELRWSRSEDLKAWSASEPVLLDGVEPLLSSLDPVACVYQGLNRLFHNQPIGVAQLRFDGDRGWSRSRPLVTKRFDSPPAVVVHDGLLTLACTMPTGRNLDTDLYLYRYDGNALGLADISFNLQAAGPVTAGVLEGELYLIYRAV